MTRTQLVVASFFGLAFAVAETLLTPATIGGGNTTGVGLTVGILGLLAALVAGIVILGQRRVHRYFRAGVPVLAAISGFVLESAFSNWLISQTVIFGPAPTTLRPAVVTEIVIGAVAYLLAATVYGFAGTRQGVRVGGRIGLLLLLLLAVIPLLNVLGAIGFVLTAFLRRPASPGPAAASE
jgi:hypothetical protein